MPEITAPMIQTFAALLLAHALADFMLQPAWMVTRKRNAFVLLLHIAIYFCVTTAALGGVWQVAVPLAFAHLVIDAAKSYLLPQRLRETFAAFTTDQALHLATLVAAAWYWPVAAQSGAFAPVFADLAPVMLVLAGFIISVTGGGFAVGLLTRRFALEVEPQGLPDAGRLIGQLERTLIFLLIYIGQPAGIGFLIAAKSILRFDTAAYQKAGEYVIIGTLASVAWALAGGYATLALLEIAAEAP